MARRNRKKRLYKKNGRFYGDFRDFRDVGGGQEALIPDGEMFATKTHSVAKQLGKARLEELRRLKKAGLGMESDLRRLGPFVDYQLQQEAMRTGATVAELSQLEHRLNVAIDYFGEDTLLRSITTKRVQEYVHVLASRDRWEGQDRDASGCIAPGTQLKYLQAVSKLLRRARSIDVIDSTHRPFQDLMDPPKVVPEEAEWLDAPTAALLLEAARLYTPKREDLAAPCAYTVVATLLLTGTRPAEGLGLLIEDIDFERKTIRIRPNRHRRLKNRHSHRVIPLWPHLEEILRAYLASQGNPTSGPLFPSPKAPGKPIRNIKRLIRELALRIEYTGHITPKVFRHTYCAARLQTTKGGAPITTLEVARELGHTGTDMVERVYSHFGHGIAEIKRRRHVDFRLEDHEAGLGERLVALRKNTEERSGHAPALANRVPLETELAILKHARSHPGRGPRKAAPVLQAAGHDVSPSGLRWVLLRYGLHRSEFRQEALRSGRFDHVIEEVVVLRSA